MLPTQVSYWTLLETQRHNQVTESQTDVANTETRRHNVATELYYTQSLEESKRHNRVTEQQAQQSLFETIRHNQASESIQRIQANASMLNARASMISASANLQNAESNRISALASKQQASVAFSRQRTDATTALYTQRKLEAERSAAQAKADKDLAEAKLRENDLIWYDINAMFNLIKPVVVKR